jgi:hypothetical protein
MRHRHELKVGRHKKPPTGENEDIPVTPEMLAVMRAINNYGTVKAARRATRISATRWALGMVECHRYRLLLPNGILGVVGDRVLADALGGRIEPEDPKRRTRARVKETF